MLHIEEEEEEKEEDMMSQIRMRRGLDEKEDMMSQSDSSSLLAEAEAVSRIVTVQLERVIQLFEHFANSLLPQ